jgi:hypothetical protein
VHQVRCKKQGTGQEGKGLGNLMKVKARKVCVGMVCEAHMGTRCTVHRVKVRHVRHM